MMRPMQVTRRSFSIALATTMLLATACNSPAISLLAPSPTPSLTPTPTLTPSPTPTPTPVPTVTLDQGDRARFVGDWDGAIGAYQLVLAETSDPALRAKAQFGIGLVDVEAERYSDADVALSAYLAQFPDDASRGLAYFLRAEARQALDKPADAVADYRQYLALRSGRIDSYVEEQIGDALRAAGQPLEAIPEYQAAIAAPHLGGDLSLDVKIGRAYMQGKDYQHALQAFDLVAATATDDATKASMNLLAGQVLEAEGDTQGAYARYLDSVNKYPTAYDSYTGLVRLVNAGVPVNDYLRGVVDYFAGAYAPALQALTRSANGNPDGSVYYFRGLTRRAMGDYEGALTDLEIVLNNYPDDPHYQQAWIQKAVTQWAYLDRYSEAVQTYVDFVAKYPQSSQAAQTLFDAGRTAERADDLQKAADLWLRLPKEYPDSDLAYQGAFEAGIALYRLSDYSSALDVFNQAEGLGSSSGDKAAAHFWVAKSYQAQGDDSRAQQAWQETAQLDPTGYYSERAADILAGRQPFQPLGVPDFKTDAQAEELAAETWLRATFNVQDPGELNQLSPALASDPRMQRGEEFWRLGRTSEAKAEFESLRASVQGDPVATFRLMHKLLDLGLYQPAIFAARNVLDLAGMNDATTLSAPVYFNHVRFGPYFGDIILPEAAQEGFDGLFLLSVVRQESLFEGFITSYAAARGLMQVIPSTGQSIADQLGWPPGYTAEDLYRPLVSVKFGTYYLAQQRDRFDGDLYAALAAYNAGPGNALIWKKLAPNDPDLFLEVIRLQQTHTYITTIYEVFDIYRNLYASP